MAESVDIQSGNLDALLSEKRKFQPADDFRRQANAADSAIYESARRDSEGFWAKEAEHLDWVTRWSKV
ncbi:MAG TPA: acetyl-coenzyme A synthetase N-terminal domain-containing protein, partial [Terriglobia bacterium]|nr:acetyl-coenzyme A synthetase N-terminal domain-containing protein [Terriglobia bacterium]